MSQPLPKNTVKGRRPSWRNVHAQDRGWPVTVHVEWDNGQVQDCDGWCRMWVVDDAKDGETVAVQVHYERAPGYAYIGFFRVEDVQRRP